MSKYEEALNYFLDREDGENVTVTVDWLDYAEELKELVMVLENVVSDLENLDRQVAEGIIKLLGEEE